MGLTDTYDYDLPRELIAQEPLRQRSDARMMVINRRTATIDHAYVRDLPELLKPGDALVLNDSRVIPARLIGRRPLTGGRWEGLFLEEESHGTWRILAKARGRMQPGDRIVLLDRESRPALELQMGLRLEDGSWIVRPLSDAAGPELLERIGRVPLPHYIRHGEMVDADIERYQTVYAGLPGSIAAPTAGLHFTPTLLRQVQQSGVELLQATLHVGVGTFRPMKTQCVEQHRMHAEWCELTAETGRRLAEVRGSGGRIVAVGTTSVRTLESAARRGLTAGFSGSTDLFIHPPFTFQAVDALLTNFHLPRSTLLVLVYTFGGEQLMREAYREAIRQRYRFFSYGDAMLIT